MNDQKDNITEVQPKDLGEAMDILFNSYLNGVQWLIDSLEKGNAPYKILDRLWYADQIAQQFINKISNLRQQQKQQKEEKNAQESLAKDTKVDESTSIQAS